MKWSADGKRKDHNPLYHHQQNSAQSVKTRACTSKFGDDEFSHFQQKQNLCDNIQNRLVHVFAFHCASVFTQDDDDGETMKWDYVFAVICVI